MQRRHLIDYKTIFWHQQLSDNRAKFFNIKRTCYLSIEKFIEFSAESFFYGTNQWSYNKSPAVYHLTSVPYHKQWTNWIFWTWIFGIFEVVLHQQQPGGGGGSSAFQIWTSLGSPQTPSNSIYRIFLLGMNSFINFKKKRRKKLYVACPFPEFHTRIFITKWKGWNLIRWQELVSCSHIACILLFY